ncbi:hypothetical protein WME90_46950 [Sorangium sp. So ce375]|uniref:hypothetical protein n=1 Tax=Sorangium sp. So ce375 TaxID=3133306 RepID=UPI003F5C81C4
MPKSKALVKAAEHSIKVAADVQRGIAAYAKGDPATIVAVAAAAGIAAIGVGLGAGAYYGAKALFDRKE